MASAVCKIPECYTDVECPTMGICKACYGSMRIAGKKTPAQRLKRLSNLTKYQARTALMNGSVRLIKKTPMVTMTTLPGMGGKKLKLKKQKLYVA